jgi:hypothetical protein
MSNPWDQHDPNSGHPQTFAASPAENASENQTSETHTAPVAEMTPVEGHKTEAPAAPAEESGAQNIDRIRDILFGSHMRDYDARFARLEQTLQKESAEVRDSTRRTIERLEAYVRLELESLNARFRTERDERSGALGQVSRDIKELGENVSKRIAEVDDRAAGSHHELREELLRHGREIAGHIDAKHQEAAALLEQRFHELRRDKTDRAALASLFSEVALRLNNEFRIPGVEH